MVDSRMHGALCIRLDLRHIGRDFKHSLLIYPQKDKSCVCCRYVKGVSSLKLHVYERVTLFWKKLNTLLKGKYIDLGAEPPYVHLS